MRHLLHGIPIFILLLTGCATNGEPLFHIKTYEYTIQKPLITIHRWREYYDPPFYEYNYPRYQYYRYYGECRCIYGDCRTCRDYSSHHHRHHNHGTWKQRGNKKHHHDESDQKDDRPRSHE